MEYIVPLKYLNNFLKDNKVLNEAWDTPYGFTKDFNNHVYLRVAYREVPNPKNSDYPFKYLLGRHGEDIESKHDQNLRAGSTTEIQHGIAWYDWSPVELNDSKITAAITGPNKYDPVSKPDGWREGFEEDPQVKISLGDRSGRKNVEHTSIKFRFAPGKRLNTTARGRYTNKVSDILARVNDAFNKYKIFPLYKDWKTFTKGEEWQKHIWSVYPNEVYVSNCPDGIKILVLDTDDTGVPIVWVLGLSQAKGPWTLNNIVTAYGMSDGLKYMNSIQKALQKCSLRGEWTPLTQNIADDIHLCKKPIETCDVSSLTADEIRPEHIVRLVIPKAQSIPNFINGKELQDPEKKQENQHIKNEKLLIVLKALVGKSHFSSDDLLSVVDTYKIFLKELLPKLNKYTDDDLEMIAFIKGKDLTVKQLDDSLGIKESLKKAIRESLRKKKEKVGTLREIKSL